MSIPESIVNDALALADERFVNDPDHMEVISYVLGLDSTTRADGAVLGLLVSIRETALDTNAKVTEIRDALVPVLTGLAPYAEDPSKLLGMLPEPLRAMFGL